ncbi:balbiani ring protein 3-like [Bombus flavifrons]|uniref:balbiani ring protein 3-like n=1 Tax=Bombus flavifrons TaxID=103934 RepID=UPI003703D3A0
MDQQSSAAKTTDESSQSHSQDESVADLDTKKSSHACECKDGCSTRRCGCVAAGIPCGQRCECKHYGCHNQQQSSAAKTTDESSQSRSQDESVADLDTKKSSHACECKDGCSTRRCGCVAAGILCGQRCECKHYGRHNQQQSSAAKTTDESSQSRSQDESVADLDTKKSSHACECKDGCSTQRCGCAKASIPCGQRCECKHYGCDNQVETTNLQQQSSAACKCKAGCSTQRCGCVKASIPCGQRCECKHYGCDNQVETTNSQQQSNTKKSSHACKCKAGCSTQRCGCVKASIPCGQRCECKHYGCDNQVQKTNSQQQSSAAKTTDESSQSRSQDESVADLDTKKSSHACECKDGCSTRRCGCVKASIPCGQRCECKHYGCDNQVETTNSQQQRKKSSQACKCKAGCSTQRCGCVKASIPCGQRCECKHYGCDNQVETTNSQQQSSAAETTDESSQSRSQDESVADLDTKKSSKDCKCKAGCSTQRCCCVKASIPCGQRCECKHYGCDNQVETTNSQQQRKKSSQACKCKAGCSTQRCGCVKASIPCGQRCECKHYGCDNQVETTNSQQQSSAAETTNESPQSRSQDGSVADLDTKKSSHACKCKKDCTTRRCSCVEAGIPCGQRCECRHYGCDNQACKCKAGCSTQRCGCVKASIPCGQRCECKHYGCDNQVETTNSQQQRNTEKSSQACKCKAGCSTQRCGCVKASIPCGQRCECKHYGCDNQVETTNSQQQSSAACKCKAGCSTQRCGCVKASIPCGQRCECKHYGCDNQVETTNSQQQSSAAETTDESSQSRSQDESVADLDTKKSSQACKCKAGCSTQRCGCVKASIPCGQRCECKHYGCDIQVETTNSQQQSSAAETTDESSQSRSQDESVADLDTKKSSHACECKNGCSTRRCGCVSAGTLCGQRCECKHYGCDNQQQSSAGKTTDESSQSRSQDESVADLDTKKSSHACECKNGCSTRRCGCVTAGTLCGQRCECKHYGCDNQQQSSAGKTTDESSQSRSQDESVADLDTKKSSHACECKNGCSTRRCGCVTAGTLCGQRCECKHYGCDNQQQSSAGKTTDESSQSRSQDESVADLDTKKSSHVCECKTGCSTRRCGCVASNILCGQQCECKYYGCDNQVKTTNSQQQSSAAKTTDESSQNRSQDESVADLDTKKSSHDCKCS